MDLYLIQPIEPLSFMREKLDEFDSMRQGSSGSSSGQSQSGPVDSFEPIANSRSKDPEKPPPVAQAVRKKSNEPPAEDNYSWD
jgi:hypothetical protein